MKIKKFTLKKEPRYNPFDDERYMIKRGKEEVVGFIKSLGRCVEIDAVR